MKFVHVCLPLTCVAACATPAAREAQPVHYQIVESFDAPGDELTIDQVYADSAAIEAGTTLRVRGHYRLASAEKAQIYFGLTNGTGSMSSFEVTPGERSFELTLHATKSGDPHVSLYAGPVVNGNNCIGKRRFEILRR